MEDPKLIAELEQGAWRLRDRVPCNFCDAVFCSDECLLAPVDAEGWPIVEDLSLKSIYSYYSIRIMYYITYK